MKKDIFKIILGNLSSILILLFLSMGYMKYLAHHVPPELALTVNLIVIPMMLGALGFFMLQAPSYIIIAALALLPIVHIFYFGSDPAKPGLEKFIGIIEYLFLCLGFIAAYLIKRFFFSKPL